MNEIMALRIMVICLATILPGLYFIFSTSIQRTCMFFSITMSIYLSLEILYFSDLSSLPYDRVIAIISVIFGCALIQFCRIKLLDYIFKPGKLLLK